MGPLSHPTLTRYLQLYYQEPRTEAEDGEIEALGRFLLQKGIIQEHYFTYSTDVELPFAEDPQFEQRDSNPTAESPGQSHPDFISHRSTSESENSDSDVEGSKGKDTDQETPESTPQRNPGTD